MKRPPTGPPPAATRRPWSAGSAAWVALPVVFGWVVAVALAAGRSDPAPALIALVGVASLGLGVAAWARRERNRWVRPVRALARNVAAFNDRPDESWDLPASADLADLAAAVGTLQARYVGLRDQVERFDRRAGTSVLPGMETGDFPRPGHQTKSGAYEPPTTVALEMMATGEFSTLDMINRLEPKTWRWLDSSLTEQEFLGWNLDQLRERSFLDVVHPDDRDLARQQLRAALARGEAHGLVFKITTARGENRSVELNIGARYGADRRVTHLRCHLADVTAKLRDEDELRRRTVELVQANDRLRRANRELQALEAELQQKNDRLARAVDELSRKNRELDEFTHVVSHDLQEPLRTLTAFSGFLLRDQGDRLDPTGRDYVNHLIAATTRMRALIRDLLDLGRAGRITDDFAPVDLAEVLAAVRTDLAALRAARHGEIHIIAPLPPIWGDRTRIGQLLTNLVANGLKYNASPAPVVEVAARVDPDAPTVRITVRDNGIGIDPRYHAKIFGMFRRLHTPEEYEGTGAGLAICQKIAHAHGGTITVESTPGNGSTFTVTLPAVLA